MTDRGVRAGGWPRAIFQGVGSMHPQDDYSSVNPRGEITSRVHVRFFYFLTRDLCGACSEVSETGLGSKIGQRQPENEWDALRPLNANPAVPQNCPKSDYH